MDVTCSRCQSVYEFDDTLVSTKGVVVRCTHCGHLFKIFPPGAAPSAPEESGWMLRREDGTVFAIDRFSTLQKWIAQGKVTRRDELSRTGESWKRIGDIVELSPFFDRVESADSAQRSDTAPSIPDPFAGRPAPRPSEPPSISFTAEARPAPPSIPPDEPASAEGPRPTTFELSASRRVTDGDPALASTTQAEPAEWPAPAPERARPAAARPSVRPPRGPAPAEMEFASAEFEPLRRSRAWIGWLIALALVIGAGTAAVLYRQQVERFVRRILGHGEPAATASERRLEQAAALLEQETPDSFRAAEALDADVLKFNSADDRALAGLLELHALRAQFLRDELDVGRVLGLAQRDPDEAQRVQRDFDNEMAAARELALALEHSGKPLDALSPGAVRALADDARLEGDRDTARTLIAQAVSREPGDPRTRWVEAMIANDDALVRGDPAAELPTVQAAFARVTSLDPQGSGLPRARVQLALFLALAGHADEARTQVRCVLDGAAACPGGAGIPHPDQVVVRKLEAWLPLLPATIGVPLAPALPSGGAPPASPFGADAGTTADAGAPDAAVDAGAAPAADAAAEAPALDAATQADAAAETIEAEAEAEAEVKDTPPDAVKEVAEMPASLDGLLDAARAALENGGTQHAIALLQRAAQIAPDNSEVQVNLGYAYLDAGRTADARRAFEAANSAGGADPDALLGLGDILLAQGSLDAALDDYQRALSLARTPYQQRIAQRKVDDLQDRLRARGVQVGSDGGARPPPQQPPPPPPPPPPQQQPAADTPLSDMPAVDSEPPGLPPVTEP